MEDKKEILYGNKCLEKCCDNCAHYEERTHFCRLNPPIPMVFYVQEGNNTIQNVSSKFATIVLPLQDFCSNFQSKRILTEN